MNILITGGVGFIGTNCALYFGKNKKNKIFIVDDFSRKDVDKNAVYLKKTLTNLKIIKEKVENIASYLDYLKKADVIIHLAGQTAVTTSLSNPTLDFNSNLLASFRLLEGVRTVNPNCIIIFASTNKVYGDLSHHKIKKQGKQYIDNCHPKGIDEKEPINLKTPYACSKGAADLYFQDYGRCYGLNTVVFRQSCIYGPHQFGVEDQGWVAHFSKQILEQKPITIFGDGLQTRDLLFVTDLIKAYELAISNIKKIKGEVFNIGGGVKNAYSLLEVIGILEKKINKKAKITFSAWRKADQKVFVCSLKKIKKMLSWQPETDFWEGIDKLINWQKNNL